MAYPLVVGLLLLSSGVNANESLNLKLWPGATASQSSQIQFLGYNGAVAAWMGFYTGGQNYFAPIYDGTDGLMSIYKAMGGSVNIRGTSSSEDVVINSGTGRALIDDCGGGSTCFEVDRSGNVTNTGNFTPSGHVNQSAAGNYAGTCVFSSNATCSITYGTAYTNTPIVMLQPVNPGSTTFTLTSTAKTGFTITASASNSSTVNWFAIGNPN